MNKYKLTELEFLNEKIKDEKQKVYRDGIMLLPGIATLTCSALAENDFGMAVGTLAFLGGLAVTSDKLTKVQKIYKKHLK